MGVYTRRTSSSGARIPGAETMTSARPKNDHTRIEVTALADGIVADTLAAQNPVEIEPGDAYYNEIAYFCRCVERGEPPTHCPPESARGSLALIERARDALRGGAVVAWGDDATPSGNLCSRVDALELPGATYVVRVTAGSHLEERGFAYRLVIDLSP